MRFLSGRGITLNHTFLDDEDVLNPASVSVTVYAADDTSVHEDAATDTDGVWSITVPMQAQGIYRVKWDGGAVAVDTEYIEVVGGYLFSIPEARASDSELVDTTDYPAAEIKGYREVIETEFQTVTGRSFTPRTARVSLETDGTDVVWTGLLDCGALVALSGPDGALTVTDYHLDSSGLLSGLEGFAEGTRLTAVIDYGLRVVPEDIKRAAFVRLQYLLAAESSGIPDRATSYVAAEGGTFTLATPGRNGYKIGIPEVDAVLNLYSYNVLASVLAVG